MLFIVDSDWVFATPFHVHITITHVYTFQARCAFTVSVKASPTVHQSTNGASNENNINQHNSHRLLPNPTTIGFSRGAIQERNTTNHIPPNDNNKHYHKACDKPPQIENGVMSCHRIAGGSKKCSPICNSKHDFYQR